MADAQEADLAAIVAISTAALHGIRSRTDPQRVAAELNRLNNAVRDRARGTISPFDNPGDFVAAMLSNADPTNG
ncbi:MAG: hypothetical protein O9325_16390 [Roseomonas sp.]|nr:hypothetical protein [Roseomonas sp.]